MALSKLAIYILAILARYAWAVLAALAGFCWSVVAHCFLMNYVNLYTVCWAVGLVVPFGGFGFWFTIFAYELITD